MSDAPAPSAPAAPSSSPAPSSSAPSGSASPSPTAKSAAPTSPGAPSGSAAPQRAALPHGGDAVGDPPPAQNNHPDAKPGETKAETVQRIKLKTKVNGREEEKEYTHEEIALHVQKGLAAGEKFDKASQKEKAFQSFLQAVQEDPFEAFKDPAFGDLGSKFEQIVIDKLANKFQSEELKAKDPREFELNELRARVAKQEAREAAEVKSRQEAAQKEADGRMWTETKKSWDAELEKAGFSSNPHLIHQMASIGQEFLDSDMDLNPNLIVAEMKNRMAEQQRLLYGSLEGEQLVNALGEDTVNRLLMYSVEKARKGRVVQEPIKPAEPVKSTDKDPEIPASKVTLRSYADFLRSK